VAGDQFDLIEKNKRSRKGQRYNSPYIHATSTTRSCCVGHWSGSASGRLASYFRKTEKLNGSSNKDQRASFHHNLMTRHTRTTSNSRGPAAEQSRVRHAHWKTLGTVPRERAWALWREDYSEYGTAWTTCPRHAALARLSLNEDGLAGICDRHQ